MMYLRYVLLIFMNFTDANQIFQIQSSFSLFCFSVNDAKYHFTVSFFKCFFQKKPVFFCATA